MLPGDTELDRDHPCDICHLFKSSKISNRHYQQRYYDISALALNIGDIGVEKPFEAHCVTRSENDSFLWYFCVFLLKWWPILTCLIGVIVGICSLLKLLERTQYHWRKIVLVIIYVLGPLKSRFQKCTIKEWQLMPTASAWDITKRHWSWNDGSHAKT